MVKFGIISCLILFVGCSTSTVCPPFPKPSQHVLDKLKSLDDREVDSWLEPLFKHNLKIKICRGEK